MNISKLSDGQREGTICSKNLFLQINLKGKNSSKLVFTLCREQQTSRINR